MAHSPSTIGEQMYELTKLISRGRLVHGPVGGLIHQSAAWYGHGLGGVAVTAIVYTMDKPKKAVLFFGKGQYCDYSRRILKATLRGDPARTPNRLKHRYFALFSYRVR